MTEVFNSLVHAPPLWTQTEESPLAIYLLDRASATHSLCITSGGDTPLRLLSEGALNVVSVDLNPAQTALAQLKTQAILHLTHSEFCTFWMKEVSDDIADLLFRIVGNIPASYQSIVKQWIESLRGTGLPLVDSGGMQGVGSEIRRFDPLLHKSIAHLANVESLAEQKKYLDLYLGDLSMHIASLRVRRSQSWFGTGDQPDPLVASSMKQQFAARLGRGLKGSLIKQNMYLTHLLLGAYSDLARPWYFEADEFYSLKEKIAQNPIQYVTSSVQDYLALVRPHSLDIADISNVLDYVSTDERERVRVGLAKAVPSGALVVHRTYTWDTLEPLGAGFRVCLDLSDWAARTDQTYMYGGILIEEKV